MQAGMLYHSLKDQGSRSQVYCVPTLFTIKGTIETTWLEQCIQQLIDRYDALRTIFLHQEFDEPVQVVLKERTFKLHYRDISPVDPGEARQYITRYIAQEKKTGFDLARDLLLRISLFKTGPDSYELVFTVHHIIMDGWCLGIIFNDLLQLYDARKNNKELRLPPVTPYREYIKWLEAQDKQEGLNYWKNYLADIEKQAGIPAVKLKTPGIDSQYQPARYDFCMEENLTRALEKTARNNQVTLNILFQTLWGILLQVYNNTDDVVFGVIVAGRPAAIDNIERMVGLFINTIPIRITKNENTTFSQLLNQTQQNTVNSQAYEYLPLAEIQAGSSLKAELIDHIMDFENFPLDREIMNQTSGIQTGFRVLDIQTFEHTNYDFDITVVPGTQLKVVYTYNALVYDPDSIKRTALHLQSLIRQVVIDPGIELKHLQVISKEEKRLILEEFNNTDLEFPDVNTFHQLFEEQVKQTPGYIAMVGMSVGVGTRFIASAPGKHYVHLTYNQLHQQSNLLAFQLRQKGVGPDTIAAIMMERSIELIIGILGILKAGGAYLPIDPNYPQDRIDYMLNDSSAKILLTGQEIAVLNSPKALNNHPKGTNSINNYQLTIYNLQLEQASLAYIIYTSGSTGKPKGVMVEHRQLVNVCLGWKQEYRLPQMDIRLLQMAPVTFDVFTGDLGRALLNGGSLILCPEEIKADPGLLYQFAKKHRVTLVESTPALLIPLMDFVYEKQLKLEHLQLLIIGSDILKAGDYQRLLTRFSHTMRIINSYGVTEAAIDTSYYEAAAVTELPDPDTNTPIGKPLPNMKLYILNHQGHMQPLGAPGELCITGTGLTRGYLNNPELTVEKFKRAVISHSSLVIGSSPKFSPNDQCPMTNDRSPKLLPNDQCPMTNDRSSKLYRTGDLARWLPDGNVQFLGRLDNQVKIRGIRIEPGEIERQILTHNCIKDTIVLVNENQSGSKYLCAYLVLVPGTAGSFDFKVIREYLSSRMPYYMIPSYFESINRVPLTANGKLDRKALPLPETAPGKTYTPPRDETQQKLVNLWQEILGTGTPIGIEDNFFDLGGHSLKATILAARIHKELQVNVPLGELFKRPTIKELSSYIKNREKDRYYSIAPAEKREYYQPSSAQKRLFFIQQMEQTGTAYNMPQVIYIKTPVIQRLETTFNRLIRRHESLRTSFHLLDELPVQRIHDKVEFEIEYYQVEVKVEKKEVPFGQVLDACGGGDNEGTRGLAPLSPGPATRSPQPATALISSFIRPFDLSQAPLMRVGLVSDNDPRQAHMMIIDTHHIVTDGISTGIAANDVISLYNRETLPPLKLQYKDYARWENSSKVKEAVKKQGEYWLKEFSGQIPVLDLPTDFPRPAVQAFAGTQVAFVIDKEQTEKIKALTSQEGVTLFMLLLTIFNIFLAKLSGQEDIIVGTPVMGRRHADLQYMVGMFVNTLALRNYPTGEKTFTQFLSRVKASSLRAFENQEYQFEDLVDKVMGKRDISRNPLFDVMFALQDMEAPAAEMPGVKPVTGEVESDISKFDLSLDAVEQGEILAFTFEYCTKLYKPGTIERWISYFKRIAAIIVHQPGIDIRDIEIIPQQEKQRILYEFNATEMEFPWNRLFHELFEEQAKRSPDFTALIGKSSLRFEGIGGLAPLWQERTEELAPLLTPLYITYRQLNEQSNQLAHVLRQKGAKPDTIVGIVMERSIEMIISVLGILKAGAAYLPIDPNHPQERINQMLADSRAKILVTVPGLSEKFEKLSIVNCQLLIVNEIPPNSRRLNNPPQEANNNLQLKGNSLAYIIYTSGSTGSAKAVIIQHRQWVNVCWGWRREYNLENIDIHLLQMAPFSFDVFAGDLGRALLNGGRLILCPDEIKVEPLQLYSFTRKHRVTLFEATPSLVIPFMDFVYENREDIPHLELLIIGSDICKTEDFKRLASRFGSRTRIINSYGVTEAAIDSSYYESQSAGADLLPGASTPIGKPLPNMKLYIMDRQGHMQPIGVPGELYIGGASVATGYLNRVELTASKFLPDPFEPNDLKRTDIELDRHRSHRSYRSHITYKSYIYRTSDLANWLPEGNVQFLGRLDNQVKIRGIRIELGEIETRLIRHKEIKDAVVIDREDEKGNKYICAYLVMVSSSSSPGPRDFTGIREYLSQQLPHYMIPPGFVSIDRVPLTPNGKVDHKALPPPPGKEPALYPEPPATETQKILAEVWQEVLALDDREPGIHDNFFETGGDSIKAIQVVTRLKKYQLKIEIRDIFLYPTIKELSRHVTPLCRVIPQEPVSGEVELTPIQRRFFENNFTDPHHYNQALMIYKKDGFSEQITAAVFEKILHHHDALRMVYKFELRDPVIGEKKVVIQENRGIPTDGKLFDLEVFDFSELQQADIETRIQQESQRLQASIHLENGPLVKLALYKTVNGDHLLIVIHHLVVDTFSWRIIMEDFSLGYRQMEKNEEPHFQEKTDSYRYWAQQLKEYAQSKELLIELEYWKQIEQTKLETLPGDFYIEKEKRKNKTNETVTVSLEEENTKKLLKEVNRVYNTEINDILLTALGLALHWWAGWEQAVINLEGHGRQGITRGIELDITRTVGWFSAEFPVVLDMTHAHDLAYEIKHIKETLRQIPNKGIGYGILRYLTPAGHKPGACLSLEPGINFNYLGEFSRDNEPDNDVFTASPMSCGQTVSPGMESEYSIDINAVAAEGKLTVQIEYNRYEFKKSNIEKLADFYLSALEKIIQHCSQNREEELTISDYSAADLDEQELEGIFEGFAS
jgi:amino acid adenylation domain-containing protein/non-ribosomal peptide synthase protein (TIGR01720 family)